MTGNRWLATARAAHTRALGSVQSFPLFGDGAYTAAARQDTAEISGDAERSGAALAEARYRDWYQARATGQTAPTDSRERRRSSVAWSTNSAICSRTSLPPPSRGYGTARRDRAHA